LLPDDAFWSHGSASSSFPGPTRGPRKRKAAKSEDGERRRRTKRRRGSIVNVVLLELKF
jgi:hypothetical protein